MRGFAFVRTALTGLWVVKHVLEYWETFRRPPNHGHTRGGEEQVSIWQTVRNL